MTANNPELISIREQAETFIRERITTERKDLEAKLADALKIEKEVTEEFDKIDAGYWALTKRDLDAEPDEEELKVEQRRKHLMSRVQSISRAIASHRYALAQLDDPYYVDRRIREKAEQLDRGRNKNGNNNDTKGGKTMAKTATKRTPVADSVLDRIVKLVQTKSQQEVADILNKEGLTTASGKPWTPQNIWHAVKKRTGKGVPRKASNNAMPRAKAKPKTAAAKRKTAAKPKASANGTKQAKPLSKSAQASGTSRGGSGSRKKPTKRPVARKK
jgi:hypothetical protein